MSKKTIARIAPFAVYALPLVAAAQTVNSTLDRVENILEQVIPIIMIIATIVFLWGVITYVISTNEDSKAKARNYMLWGIIGLAVMVAVWGLALLLVRTFGVGGVGIPNEPGQF